jgi:hypothetical protein
MNTRRRRAESSRPAREKLPLRSLAIAWLVVKDEELVEHLEGEHRFMRTSKGKHAADETLVYPERLGYSGWLNALHDFDHGRSVELGSPRQQRRKSG